MLELEATRHLQHALLPSSTRILAPPQKRPRLYGRPFVSTHPSEGCLPRVRTSPLPSVRCAAAYVPQARSKTVPRTEQEVLDEATAPAPPLCHSAHDHHAHDHHAHDHHGTTTHNHHSTAPTTLRLAAVPLSHTASAASPQVPSADAAAAPPSHDPFSTTASFVTAATLSSLDLLTQSLDVSSTFETDSEDGEMCTLVQTDYGDVQMVCDSDPTHPISTAEVAALNPIVPATLLQVRAQAGLLHRTSMRTASCTTWDVAGGDWGRPLASMAASVMNNSRGWTARSGDA